MTTFESTTTRLAREELGACTLIQDLLPLYIEGEVSTSSHDLIVEHLARCERCAGFLAGAQSVRGQLRRDTTQRAMVAAAHTPMRRIVSRGQMTLMFFAMLIACALGSISVVLLVEGISGNLGLFVGGGPIFLFSLFLLAMLAKARGPLTIERVLLIAVSCIAGVFASLLAFVAASDAANLLGFMSGMGALVVMWLGVWNIPVIGNLRGNAPANVDTMM